MAAVCSAGPCDKMSNSYRAAVLRLGGWEPTGSDLVSSKLCAAPVLTQKLQLALLGMSTECVDPWTGGPQGQALSPGGQYGALASGSCLPPSASASWSLPRWRAYLAAAVLCYINLLNYMNWFIIPGEEGRGTPTLQARDCAPMVAFLPAPFLLLGPISDGFAPGSGLQPLLNGPKPEWGHNVCGT